MIGITRGRTDLTDQLAAEQEQLDRYRWGLDTIIRPYLPTIVRVARGDRPRALVAQSLRTYSSSPTFHPLRSLSQLAPSSCGRCSIAATLQLDLPGSAANGTSDLMNASQATWKRGVGGSTSCGPSWCVSRSQMFACLIARPWFAGVL